eukprot:Sspe_Gene.94598::Locus_66949_Transcript_1_1_Confidence_1.000_Length_732::g.94598::m.94598
MRSCFFSVMLLLLLGGALVVEGVRYEMHVYKTKSYASKDTSEAGKEEYRVTGYLKVGTKEGDIGCVKCNKDGNCAKDGKWAELTGSTDNPLTFDAYIEAWEDDVGKSCKFESGDNGRTRKTCTHKIDEGPQGQWNTATCGDKYNEIRYTWRWWPVNCKGGTGLPSADYSSNCADVSPGGKCIVQCRPQYLPSSATFMCSPTNKKTTNKVAGSRPTCILRTPPRLPAPTPAPHQP